MYLFGLNFYGIVYLNGKTKHIKTEKRELLTKIIKVLCFF